MWATLGGRYGVQDGKQMRLELGKEGVGTWSSFASSLSLGRILSVLPSHIQIVMSWSVSNSQKGNSDLHLLASDATQKILVCVNKYRAYIVPGVLQDKAAKT